MKRHKEVLGAPSRTEGLNREGEVADVSDWNFSNARGYHGSDKRPVRHSSGAHETAGTLCSLWGTGDMRDPLRGFMTEGFAVTQTRFGSWLCHDVVSGHSPHLSELQLPHL